METSPALADLIGHLERTLGLEAAAAARVIGEVVAYFHETLEQFVIRRHGELQGEDRRNEDIFDQIAVEVAERRFAAAPLTRRQIRRLIYG
jgi:hypothetical protein